jgi:molecular chaperone DnaJ
MAMQTDVMAGYGRWLETQGFEFDEYGNDIGETLNWKFAIKEFAYWSSQNWADNSVIAISPFANSIKFTFQDSVVDDIFSSFSDMFGDGGGSRQNKSMSRRGSDVRYNLTISLEEAFNGIVENISFSIPCKCESCNGGGSANNQAPIQCNNCGGSGKIRAQQGFFIVERPCTSCSGSGQIIKDPCKKCNGQGRVNREKTLSVKIPAGVDEDSRIKVAKEGEAGIRGGGNGDLFIFISIKNHQFFQRKENDLYFEMPLRFTTAILGGELEIPTIDGSKVKINIKEGTQNGDQFRLKSKGMTILNSGGRRGDMYVKFNIETPIKLSQEERDIIKKLDELMVNKANNPKSESFFQKVSDFFKN